MPMPRDVFHLSDEQFDKIVELLTPGWELSKAYLAEYQSRNAKLAEYEASAGYDTGNNTAIKTDEPAPADESKTDATT